MLRRFSFLFILIFSISSINVFASSEIRDFYFGARSKAMGGAYVGLADDEQALYLNPAGLAYIEKPEIHYGVLDIDISSDVYSSYADTADAFSNFSAESINSIMGKNIYGRAQISPSLIMPNFGVGVLVDGQAAFYSKNQALPNITFGYQNTNAIQVATGFSISGITGGGRRRRRSSRGDLSIGLGFKAAWRRGGYRQVPLITLFNLSQGKSLITEFAGNFGIGFGFDVGSLYVLPLGKDMRFSLGTAFTNIGDMSFSNTDPEPQKGNLSLGMAFQFNPGLFKLIIAYDYSNILDQIDWRKKNHFGFEFKFTAFSVHAGLNQSFITLGGAFDIWVLRITGLTYATELGSLVQQDVNRRYSLRLDFKFDL